MAKMNENFPADDQLKAAIIAVKKHDRNYQKVDYWKKKKAIARYDVIGDPNENPKLLVLCGHDGGVQHAIAVVGRTIFDSNLRKGLTLSKESLYWCCNCNGGFQGVYTISQFRK